MSEERDWDEAHREPVQTTPRYEHYQFQEKPRTVVTKPGKSGNRKPGSSFGKKLGTTVALAVVFGLVASAVFQAAILQQINIWMRGQVPGMFRLE